MWYIQARNFKLTSMNFNKLHEDMPVERTLYGFHMPCFDRDIFFSTSENEDYILVKEMNTRSTMYRVDTEHSVKVIVRSTDKDLAEKIMDRIAEKACTMEIEQKRSRKL